MSVFPDVLSGAISRVRFRSASSFGRVCLAVLVTGAIFTSQVFGGEQYTLDNRWDQAKTRLSLLEQWSNPYSIEQLEKLNIKKGWTVLDAGAGLGGMSRWLSKKVGDAGHVDALDMETVLLEKEPFPGNVSVVKKNLVTDALPDGKYDLILIRDVLMHIPDREKVVRKLAAALKPGGILMAEDLGNLPEGTRFNNFSDDSAVNHLAEETYRIVELGNHMSFRSCFQSPEFFRAAGLTDITGHGTVPLSAGGDMEAKVMAMSLMQLKPLMEKKGVDPELFEKTRENYKNKSALWWGLMHVTTVGRKS